MLSRSDPPAKLTRCTGNADGPAFTRRLHLYRLCSSKTITAALAAPLLQKTPEEAEAILKRLSTDAIALLERTRATIGRSSPVFRLRAETLKRLGSAVVYQRRTTDEIDRKVIAHVRGYGKIANRTLQNF